MDQEVVSLVHLFTMIAFSVRLIELADANSNYQMIWFASYLDLSSFERKCSSFQDKLSNGTGIQSLFLKFHPNNQIITVHSSFF